MSNPTPTLGQKLREARERRGLTSAQVAAATHIKGEHIEAMERDDFSGLPIPTYAKGFIKIYAEYLGLDPQPLVQEYLERHAPRERPRLVAAPPRPPVGQRVRRVVRTLFEKWLAGLVAKLPRVRPREAMAGLAVILLVALVARGVARRRREPGQAARPPAVARAAFAPEGDIIEPPPDPYLELEEAKPAP